jgi:hypothetical protein
MASRGHSTRREMPSPGSTPKRAAAPRPIVYEMAASGRLSPICLAQGMMGLHLSPTPRPSPDHGPRCLAQIRRCHRARAFRGVDGAHVVGFFENEDLALGLMVAMTFFIAWLMDRRTARKARSSQGLKDATEHLRIGCARAFALQYRSGQRLRLRALIGQKRPDLIFPRLPAHPQERAGDAAVSLEPAPVSVVSSGMPSLPSMLLAELRR